MKRDGVLRRVPRAMVMSLSTLANRRPTLNWPASSLTITASRSSPCATTPERALGGDLDRVRLHLERRDTEAFEVRLPVGRVGEAFAFVRGQQLDRRVRQRPPAHVGQRRVVDHVVGVPGAQEFQEVQPAL